MSYDSSKLPTIQEYSNCLSSLQLSCFGTSQLYHATISLSICTNAYLQNASSHWFGFAFLLQQPHSQVRQKLSYSTEIIATLSPVNWNDPWNGNSVSSQLTSSSGFAQWLIADLKSSFSSFDSFSKTFSWSYLIRENWSILSFVKEKQRRHLFRSQLNLRLELR